jgi:hypothetical protein
MKGDDRMTLETKKRGRPRDTDSAREKVLNVRMRARTHETLKAIASARGVTLIDLLDEMVLHYHALVDPLRALKSLAHKPSLDWSDMKALKVDVVSDSEAPA